MAESVVLTLLLLLLLPLMLLLLLLKRACPPITFRASRLVSASLSPPPSAAAAAFPGFLAASPAWRTPAPCTSLGANFLGTFFGSSHHTLPPSAAAHLLLQLG